MTMMRTPAQRLLSGFHHGPHGPHGVVEQDRDRVRAGGITTYASYCPNVADFNVTRTAGATIVRSSASKLTNLEGETFKSGKMKIAHLECIANQQCGYILGRPCQTDADAQAAADRLRGPANAFKFVGLAEHWEASICVFHRMLGGRPVRAEFERARTHAAGAKRADGWYAEPASLAKYDQHDRTVYAAARVRFLRQIRNVTGGWRCAFDDRNAGPPQLMCTRHALKQYAPSDALGKTSTGSSSRARASSNSQPTIGLAGFGQRHRASSWHVATIPAAPPLSGYHQ